MVVHARKNLIRYSLRTQHRFGEGEHQWNLIIGYFRGRELKLLYLINQQYKCRVLDIIMQIITNLGSLPAVIAVPLILLLS